MCKNTMVSYIINIDASKTYGKFQTHRCIAKSSTFDIKRKKVFYQKTKEGGNEDFVIPAKKNLLS